MDDESTIALKNKVAEMKERLNQMYSQSFADAGKSKAFDAEFSLYVKSSENARTERADTIRLQNIVVLAGLAVMVAASLLSINIFTVHILFGMLILLGFGFIGCSFLFLLLAAEMRVQRAEGFCLALETYFREQRWAQDANEKLGLAAMPMWEQYRSQWSRDAFAGGPYRTTSLYAPFRVAIMFIDLIALVYMFLQGVSGQTPIPWVLISVCALGWILSVSAQMLLVQTVICKVDSHLKRGEEERQRRIEPCGISLYPGSWLTIMKLFFLLDIIFPGRPESPASGSRME